MPTPVASRRMCSVASVPGKGFAGTIILGGFLSRFSAVTVVRVVMPAFVRRRQRKTLEIEPLFRLAAGDTAISFMRARYLGIGTSILLSLASVALFVNPGLNYGIDFKGGKIGRAHV